ncbi:hypothetical protein GCM10020358_61460 [Amorphoplanes nipponensis]|uniref:Cell wall-active antibiotics response LiaF-like C-terminal domain-containing protein n=1 Tax=Actinoplanes nipponensis TaxID=135950 RepID=A0A919JR57_9ACTN|nr:LiaF domain-containing protein [Actinoplanes nipponensis]GIE53950.1 hypothetical protein Ani05nite_74840 [Actinoplanes nipponensis]
MTTVPAPAGLGGRTAPRWGPLIAGLLVVAAGVAWLLDGLGVPVPWRVLPAVGLLAVGLAVLVLRRVPGALAAAGVLLLIAAILAALPVRRYAGPVGQRSVAPAATEWPVHTVVGIGELRVDLTERALPAGGRMEVAVGIGKLSLTVPAGGPVRVVSAVGSGDIEVDGRSVDNGIDAGWTQAGAGPAVDIDARVGLGLIEVWHE